MKSRFSPQTLTSAFIARSNSYPDGYIVDWHHHDFAQLVYACSGVMTVKTPDNLWVIPPQRAVRVPLGIPHRVSMHGRAEMRSLYIQPDAFQNLPEQSCVLGISPLMRELILYFADSDLPIRENSERERMILVTIDQLKQAPSVSLQLPEPHNERLKPICEAIQAHPENNDSLAQWAERVCVSSRTLSRRFRSELGLSFVEYRQQARLFAALKQLAKGMPVTHVAMNTGFSSLSAFNRLFKRNFGTSPGRFFI